MCGNCYKSVYTSPGIKDACSSAYTQSQWRLIDTLMGEELELPPDYHHRYQKYRLSYL